MSDLLARVAAIAARESAKSTVSREDMRAKHPEFAAKVDGLRAVFGEPNAVVFGGVRYGKPLPWFRRNQQFQPPIPGVSYASDSGVRAGKSRHQSRKGSGVSRARSGVGVAGAAEARPWWDADDERQQEGDDV